MQSELAQGGDHDAPENIAGDAYIQDWLKGKFQAAFAWNGADPTVHHVRALLRTGANSGVPAGYSFAAVGEVAGARRLGVEPGQPQSHLDAVVQRVDSNAGVDLAVSTAYDLRRPVTANVTGSSLESTNSTSLCSLRSTTFS